MRAGCSRRQTASWPIKEHIQCDNGGGVLKGEFISMSEMTHRERFRTVLRGEMPDRIPIVCRLNIYHQTREYQNDFPEEIAGKSLEQMQLDLGMGVSARIAHDPKEMSQAPHPDDDPNPRSQIFHMYYRKPVEHVRWREGYWLYDEWRAPSGTLHMERKFAEDDEERGIKAMIREFPVKTLDDYAIYEEVIQHRVYEPTYSYYEKFDRELGDKGLPLVIIHELPIHDLMLNWVGYENTYYHLMDKPEVVEHAVEIANEKYREMWDIAAKSPAEMFMHGIHFDTAITPVKIFDKYFMPYITEFNKRMHEDNKWTVFHGDSNLALLLEHVLQGGYDVADCLATQPLVKCDFEKSRRHWGNKMTIWGGVPSILLEKGFSDEKLEEHMEMILREVTPGQNFIAGIADQAMPPSLFSRIKQMSDFFVKKGKCPLQPSGETSASN